jgi:hypothetical protein
MSAHEHWQMDASAPELYKRYLVPAITSIWANDLLDRVGLRSSRSAVSSTRTVNPHPADAAPGAAATIRILIHSDGPSFGDRSGRAGKDRRGDQDHSRMACDRKGVLS